MHHYCIIYVIDGKASAFYTEVVWDTSIQKGETLVISNENLQFEKPLRNKDRETKANIMRTIFWKVIDVAHKFETRWEFKENGKTLIWVSPKKQPIFLESSESN